MGMLFSVDNGPQVVLVHLLVITPLQVSVVHEPHQRSIPVGCVELQQRADIIHMNVGSDVVRVPTANRHEGTVR